MIFRFLILIILFFLAYTLFDMLKRALSHQKKPLPREKTNRGEDMVRDPHCGTYIPVSDALPASIGGKRHYFCSKKCRDSYKKA